MAPRRYKKNSSPKPSGSSSLKGPRVNPRRVFDKAPHSCILGSGITHCSKKKEKKRNIIKYMDQLKAHLYKDASFTMRKKKFTRRDHTLNPQIPISLFQQEALPYIKLYLSLFRRFFEMTDVRCLIVCLKPPAFALYRHLSGSAAAPQVSTKLPTTTQFSVCT